MAFLENTQYFNKDRFSLLLLEPSEIYFEDFSVFYYPPYFSEMNSVKNKQRGRLKLCSKSLIFDPSDFRYPLLKLSFQHVSNIEQFIPSYSSKIDSKKSVIHLESNLVTEMKEDNLIAPYKFIKKKQRLIFSFVYEQIADFLQQTAQLLRASTLPLGDRMAMINAIVTAKQLRLKFDSSVLESFQEHIVSEKQGYKITPLVTNPGKIVLSSSRLYFQPYNNVEDVPIWKINLKDITHIIRRRFLLRHIGLEIFCSNMTISHLYLCFLSNEERDQFYDDIMSLPLFLEDTDTNNMTLKWQNGVISNFDYLMYLNSIADRSINDLTQYPVFPWVIANYDCDVFDLEDQNMFRDLSKPMGALNSERLARLKQRYEDSPEPKFLYGTHYSTPGFVLFYLARVAPEYMLCLQYGKFDHPDRMFNSMNETWNNCLNSFSDFKELIPEFYDSSGAFLKANASVNYGTRTIGKPVGDVTLPKWAFDEKDFIVKLRAALECDYVSSNLHNWIDLIFGCKQRGSAALKADNIFYHLTYEGAVDLENVDDLNERHSLEIQIMEFGQIPKQIFNFPHPRKIPLSKPSSSFSICENNESLYSFTDNVMDKNINNNNLSSLCSTSVDDDYIPHIDDKCISCKLHKDSIIDVKWSPDYENLFSCAQDSFLKVYNRNHEQQRMSVSLSNMPLSSLVVLSGGSIVIAGCYDNNLYVYSVEYGKMLEQYYAHNDSVSGLCNIDDIIISSSWDSTIKLWNLTTANKKISHLKLTVELDVDEGISSVCLRPDKSNFSCGSVSGNITLFDTCTQMNLMTLSNHCDKINDLRFSEDGRCLISCAEDSFLKIIDICSGTEIFSNKMDVSLKCLSWKNSFVYTGCSSGFLELWDMRNAKCIGSHQAHEGSVTCLDVSNDRYIATGGADKVIKIWEIH